jgi:hypothetical protein
MNHMRSKLSAQHPHTCFQDDARLDAMRFIGDSSNWSWDGNREWLSSAAEGCSWEISGKLLCDPDFIAFNSSITTPKLEGDYCITEYECAGQNALHLAALNGEAAVCEVLLKCRADVNKLDDGYQSPLFLAAWAGKSLECVKVLLDYNAAIDVRNSPHK